MKPVGPVSKAIQMSGGPDYRKLLQKGIQLKGSLQIGEMKQFQGRCTYALWIYNTNLPKLTLGKDKSPRAQT